MDLTRGTTTAAGAAGDAGGGAIVATGAEAKDAGADARGAGVAINEAGGATGGGAVTALPPANVEGGMMDEEAAAKVGGTEATLAGELTDTGIETAGGRVNCAAV